jgi:CRP-like cAMP-binding protein
MDDVQNLLSESDWNIILEGAKMETYKKGSMVIEQGSKYQKIYQITRGCCRIEIDKDGEIISNNKLLEIGSTFGETSFLTEEKPNCSIIAISDGGVDFIIIEGIYINTLFTIDPKLAARFYRYLSVLMVYRIRECNLIP